MKILFLLLALAFGSLDKEWKAYHEAVRNDYPRTADSLLCVIEDKARRTADYQSLCEALALRGDTEAIRDYMISHEEKLKGSHKVNSSDYPYIDDYEYFLWQLPQYGDRLEEYCRNAGERYKVNWALSAVRLARSAGDYEKILSECDGYVRYVPLRYIYRNKVVSCRTEKEFLAADSLLEAAIEEARRVDRKVRGYGISAGAFIKDMEDMREAMRRPHVSVPFAGNRILPYPAVNRIRVHLYNSDYVTAAVYAVPEEDVSASRFISGCPVGNRKNDIPGTEVWKARIDNPAGSFCVADTVYVDFPEMPDGTYCFRISDAGGETVWSMEYMIASLAVSQIEQPDSQPRYLVSDARTGEPVGEAFYELKYSAGGMLNGKMEFNGFTTLGFDVTGYGDLRFVTGDGRMSPWTMVSAPVDMEKYFPPRRLSYFFTDAGLYHPGDTVRFKGISYLSTKDSVTALVSSPVKVYIADLNENCVDSLVLVTNDFGSVSGEYVLPENCPAGLWWLSGNDYGTAFRVEYSKPSGYTADIIPIQEIFTSGDSVRIGGTVAMAGGISPSRASVSWIHRSYTDTVSGNVSLEQAGRFSIPLKVAGGYNCLDVKAVFPDGAVAVADYTFYGSEEGAYVSLTFDADREVNGRYYVLGDNLRYDVSVLNNSGVRQETSGADIVLEGPGGSRFDPADISMRNMPAGKYRLSASLGNSVSDAVFYYVPENMSSMEDFGEDCIYFPLDSGSYVIGSSDTLWVSRAFGPLERVLPGLNRFAAGAEETVFFLKDGVQHMFRFKPQDVSGDEIEMKVSSFRDKSVPGSEECFMLEFDKKDDVEVMVDIYDGRGDSFINHNYDFTPERVLPEDHYTRVRTETGHAVGNTYVMEKRYSQAMTSSVADNAVSWQNRAGIRTDFRPVAVFFPQLRPDEDGRIRVSYTLPDNITSYKVQILAHDRSMRSHLWRNKIDVAAPLTVSSSVPEFLTEGDSLCLNVLARNLTGEDMSGHFRVEVLDGDRILFVGESEDTVVEASGERSSVFMLPAMKEGRVTLRFWFISESGYSDGESHDVEVRPVFDEIVRAVTGLPGRMPVLAEDYDPDADYRLRVTVPLGSVLESIPYVEAGDNPSSIDLASAIQALRMVRRWKDTDSLVSVYSVKLREFIHPSGGFTWFPGGKPSRYVTMAVLDRFSVAETFGCKCTKEQSEYILAAVRWLDREFIRVCEDEIRMSGELLDYLYIRSVYAGRVQMEPEVRKMYRKCLSVLKSGHAAGMGIGSKLKAASILSEGKEYDKVMKSLSEYTERDRWGNRYFRTGRGGLFGSDVFINSLAANLYKGRDSMMVRELVSHILSVKDGMSWSGNFCTAVAVAAVLSSGVEGTSEAGQPYFKEKILDRESYDSLRSGGIVPDTDGVLKIYSILKTSREDIRDMESFSNGLSVSTQWYRQDPLTGKETTVCEGDTLTRGDRIMCRYVISNDEDRSFVRFSAMYPPVFEAAAKLSGYHRSGAYRTVENGRVVYNMEFLGKGDFVVEEVFFVRNSGVFTSGYAEAECLYSDAYRGISSSRKVVVNENPAN